LGPLETGNAENNKLVFQVAHHPAFRSGLPTLDEGGPENDNFTERDLGHRGFQRSGGGPFAWNYKAPVPGLVHSAKPAFQQVDLFDSRMLIQTRVSDGKLPKSAIVYNAGVPGRTATGLVPPHVGLKAHRSRTHDFMTDTF
jgi:hypothetical protein